MDNADDGTLYVETIAGGVTVSISSPNLIFNEYQMVALRIAADGTLYLGINGRWSQGVVGGTFTPTPGFIAFNRRLVVSEEAGDVVVARAGVWDGFVTDEEFQQIFNSGLWLEFDSFATTTPLLHYWRFEEGDITADSVGACTLVNFGVTAFTDDPPLLDGNFDLVDPGSRDKDGSLDKTNAFLEDLLAVRGPSSGGGNAHRAVEMYGGNMVETTAFEPDPTTFRGNYYYNTVRNVLYRKVVTEHKPREGSIIAHWKPASSPT
jgi:hypothetical protein